MLIIAEYPSSPYLPVGSLIISIFKILSGGMFFTYSADFSIPLTKIRMLGLLSTIKASSKGLYWIPGSFCKTSLAVVVFSFNSLVTRKVVLSAPSSLADTRTSTSFNCLEAGFIYTVPKNTSSEAAITKDVS